MDNITGRLKEVFQNATCVFTKAQVEQSLDDMARRMSDKLKDRDPIFICILQGGIVPLGNLLPRLDFQMEINYIHLSSYGMGQMSGEMVCKAEPTVKLEGRTVVVIDDILDTGATLRVAADYCKEHGAREVFTAVLLDKQKPRKPGGVKNADFAALTLDDQFVFGYGLDYKEYLRNAPGIYAVAPKDQE